MKSELALPTVSTDLRGVWRLAHTGMPARRWLPRVELALLVGIGGYFGLSLLLLASKV